VGGVVGAWRTTLLGQGKNAVAAQRADAEACQHLGFAGHQENKAARDYLARRSI